MNRRIQSLKIVVVATLLYTFQPIALTHADGPAPTPAAHYVTVVSSPESAGSINVPSMAASMRLVSDPYSMRFVSARPAVKHQITVLSIEPLKSFEIGDPPIVVLHLNTDSGAPIANRRVRILSYKNRKAEGVTDSKGTAQIPLRFNFSPGTYDLTAVFNGSEIDGLDLSYASAKLVIVPAQVQIRTVPRLAGIQFSFNNQILVSDANGEVQFTVDHIGTYHVEVLPVVQQDNSNVHIGFYRWNDDVYVPYREFKIPRHHILEAGFLLSNPVNLDYSDQANQPVDPARISLVSMRTGGTNYTLKDPTRGWLPANRIVHRVGSALESIPAIYYIENVTIDSSNVVNESQLRYQVHPNDTWPIKLFLFSAYLSARDALFHFPIESRILLEFPDGTKKELPFGSSGAVIKVASLPRGHYYATVKGAGGIAPRMPLALSRDQHFVALVISRLDLGILFGIPALIALVLLLIGRSRELFASLGRRPSRT